MFLNLRFTLRDCIIVCWLITWNWEIWGWNWSAELSVNRASQRQKTELHGLGYVFNLSINRWVDHSAAKQCLKVKTLFFRTLSLPILHPYQSLPLPLLPQITVVRSLPFVIMPESSRIVAGKQLPFADNLSLPQKSLANLTWSATHPWSMGCALFDDWQSFSPIGCPPSPNGIHLVLCGSRLLHVRWEFRWKTYTLSN